MIFFEKHGNGFALRELLTEIKIYIKRLYLIRILGRKYINVKNHEANILAMVTM